MTLFCANWVPEKQFLRSIFKRFYQPFFITTGLQHKLLILIESPNIFHSKSAKKIKVGLVFCGETWDRLGQMFIVCIGVSTHLKSFFTSPPLKSTNFPSPPFLGNPPMYWPFVPRLPKTQVFPWTPKVLKFFIFRPILSFKSI